MPRPNRQARSVSEVASESEAVTDAKTLEEQVKSALSDSWQTLQQIQDVQSPTNAQVVAAVKFLAKNQQDIMRYLAKQFLREHSP